MLDEATFFEAAHTSAAQAGQSAVPTDLDVDTHFITFIEALNDKGCVEVLLVRWVLADEQGEASCRDGRWTRSAI